MLIILLLTSYIYGGFLLNVFHFPQMAELDPRNDGEFFPSIQISLLHKGRRAVPWIRELTPPGM